MQKYQQLYGDIKRNMPKSLLGWLAFHTICNALAVLGKRFQDAGSCVICLEPGVVAEGSVNGVLEGKMYNRTVRVHKLIYEAFMRLIWEQFMSLMEEDEQEYLT